MTVAAAWQAKTGTFTAKLPIPAKVRKATATCYTLTIRENVGTGLVTAPPLGHNVNPETIRFS